MPQWNMAVVSAATDHASALCNGAACPAPSQTTAEFVGVLEACAILGKRKSQVYELAARGYLPVVRQGRSVRFSLPGLRALHEAAARAAIDRTVAPLLEPGPLDPSLVQRLGEALAPVIEQAATRAAIAAVQHVAAGRRRRRQSAQPSSHAA